MYALHHTGSHFVFKSLRLKLFIHPLIDNRQRKFELIRLDLAWLDRYPGERPQLFFVLQRFHDETGVIGNGRMLRARLAPTARAPYLARIG